jgi:serine/threonine-protein kinase
MAVRKVGTCRIVRELGRGGMGVVYEAVQEGLDRRVAVKALDAKLSGTPEVVERFKREGRAYAQLRHQAVVTVHDLVEKDDSLYLITEFVDGADLARILKQGGALPPDCVAIIGARMAEALDYIHFHKLLHRDVKPANIMLSLDGEVKLVDFGIAKDQTADDLTREGVVVGSPAYMPPEVMNGGEADAKAEIWALGVTLFELAAARRPFQAATTEALVQAVRGGSFPRLRSLAPGVPRRLARAIERCLKKKPRDRWGDAGALAVELERCATRCLGGLGPRARLVGLLTHRGFMGQQEALTRIDSKSLLASLVIDEATMEVALVPRPRRWQWALLLLLAAGAGAVALWGRYRGLL